MMGQIDLRSDIAIRSIKTETVPSKLVTHRKRPEGDQLTDDGRDRRPRRCTVHFGFSVVASQIMALPSFEHEANRSPCGDQATRYTLLVWPSRTSICSHVSVRHSRNVLSADAETRRSPAGFTLMLDTSSRCP